jgi:cytochrome P450
MNEPATVNKQTAAAPPEVRLPPALPRIIPKAVQGIAFFAARRWTTQLLARLYGSAFRLHVPVFGHLVVVVDPQLAKHVYTADQSSLGAIQPNLSRLVGPGSVFGLEGDNHRRRRRLLAQPFHASNMRNYEAIVEEEVLREMAGWPDGERFETIEPMRRITLNVILRAVFGAEGADFDELRNVIQRWIALGAPLATLPIPKRSYGRYTPWGRLAEWRRRYDAIIDRVIDKARTDPNFEHRTDILALMLHSTYEDGSAMAREDIRDDLLALLCAGHETTATTLGWIFERLSRHPEVLSALTAEADTDDSDLRHATIYEVQRTRPTVDISGRRVTAPVFELGQWVIPRGHSIVVSISQCHVNRDAFPEPDRFDPQRYIGSKPSPFAWIPFGGGTRRCAGAAFAKMEMNVVLRTVLRHFSITTTAAPGEKWQNGGGLGFTPKSGGRIVVHRRSGIQAPRSIR